MNFFLTRLGWSGVLKLLFVDAILLPARLATRVYAQGKWATTHVLNNTDKQFVTKIGGQKHQSRYSIAQQRISLTDPVYFEMGTLEYILDDLLIRYRLLIST